MKWPIGIAAGICLYLMALFLMQDSLILRPDIAARAHSGSMHGDGIAWQDNGQYRGLVIEPSGAARGTILLFHGNASLAQGLIRLAVPFVDQGLRVVLPEYPGYGQRAGEATVANILKSTRRDFERARQTWPGPVYIGGHSFGAGMAAQLASAFPDEVTGVVLFTPWKSLDLLVREAFFGLPLGLLLRNRLDSAAALDNYCGPVVIVAAARDAVIPARHAKRLAAHLRHPEYIEMNEADHVSWLAQPMPEIYARIFNALQWQQADGMRPPASAHGVGCRKHGHAPEQII